MLIVTGTFGIPKGALETARPGLREMVRETLREPGCIAYDFWVHPEDDTRIRVYEEWEDHAALEAHFNTPHMARFREVLGGLGPVTREVKAIEAGAVTPL